MVIARFPDTSPAVGTSSYLQYLPAIYSPSDFLGRVSAGDFMGRFLMIFESVLAPIENVVQNIAYYLDPALAPEELVAWLASWVNLVLDESWPLERRRDLVSSAVELYQWRGTRRGLKEYLRVYTGVEPSIIEQFGGMPLNGQARLGLNALLGEGRRHFFTVTLELEAPDSIDVRRLRAIIESEKPAHAGYSLELREAN